MYEWWNAHFHAAEPRPARIDDDALDSMYLKRKRFLFEKFGVFGIGEENPVMDGRHVNTVIKYGMDLIPHIYGASLACQAPGGYMPKPFSKEELAGMAPAEINAHPIRDWTLGEKKKKEERYGSAFVFLDYESPANIAVRLRGEDFYSDMIEDPGFARHVLSLCTETILSVLKFSDELTGAKPEGEGGLSLGNCNVVLMSPAMYAEIIKPFDVLLINEAMRRSGRKLNLNLHHCDVKADGFIGVYKDLPNLTSLQANHGTDIEAVRREMPGVSFLSMINPAEMASLGPAEMRSAIFRAVRLGSTELDLWNIDPAVHPARLYEILSDIRDACAACGKKPVFEAMPFVWDELEWAYPMYQNRV